ncbi:RidA family protein [Cellulomonas xylanilytica]|uniref:Reactive intermediate/imine deaminase n=1 Tax=Cellulomonas xylanilytica TaxID=233583 RepID=A0A510V868_9CELL|nr:Rid family detoxifying hydrolase [Cellulomonas xylanilytica]GEK22966.1 reactive intermediate/imine deaminase [Cellulomonas xylanilytica]
MTREKISTPDAPQPAGNYSQGIRLGNLVWTAGFGPQDPVTGEIPESVADQTRRVLRNVEATLAEAGLDLGDVVKTTVHLADLADFAEFDAAYGEFFPYPKPARTTVGSQLAGIKVEIDVVAGRLTSDDD